MAGFAEALVGSQRRVVMEIKRQDGHGRPLLGDTSLPDVVAAYEAAGAPCLSVVTGRWFGGSDAMLSEVAELTSLPLLQKDFITRRSQLGKARDLGASAVLLTAALLPRDILTDLAETALSSGLTPFVEVADRGEIDALPVHDGCVVAVNNKDIGDRERGANHVDRSIELLPALVERGVACPVSASGIASPEAAARLLRSGYAGLLMGTALLVADDLEAWLAELDRLS